jgi:hypothetical protein
MAAGFAPEQVAQLKRATDSLAALAQQVHSLPRRQTDARADLGSALLSAETEQSLRETEQIMATLRPHLERTERRLLSKIKQVGDRREQEADGVTVSHGGGGLHCVPAVVATAPRAKSKPRCWFRIGGSGSVLANQRDRQRAFRLV